MAARKNSILKDLLTFASLIVVIVGLGGMMRGLQSYFSGDWSKVASCQNTYWMCRSEFTGMSVGERGSVTFAADAKACAQMRAYDSAIRRAKLDCSSSHSVRRNSCREVSTLCDPANNPQYY